MLTGKEIKTYHKTSTHDKSAHHHHSDWTLYYGSSQISKASKRKKEMLHGLGRKKQNHHSLQMITTHVDNPKVHRYNYYMIVAIYKNQMQKSITFLNICKKQVENAI